MSTSIQLVYPDDHVDTVNVVCMEYTDNHMSLKFSNDADLKKFQDAKLANVCIIRQEVHKILDPGRSAANTNQVVKIDKKDYNIIDSMILP